MNWSDFFKLLALNITSITVITGGIGYLGSLIFKRWFKAREQDYEHKLKFLEKEHEHALDTQMQVHLESLKRLSQRDQITFAALHDKRAEKLEGIYSNLVDLRSAAYKEQPDDFEKQIVVSFQYYVKSRIFLSEKLGDHIESFLRLYEEICEIKFTELHMKGVPGLQRHWIELIKKRADFMGVRLPMLFRELETEARNLLKVEED